MDLFRLSKANREKLKRIEKLSAMGKMPAKYAKRKLKGKIGYGIFLKPNASPIKKGEIIGPYEGEVRLEPQNSEGNGDYAFDLIDDLRLTKEEQKKFDPKNRFSPKRLYALKVDALKKGSFVRFVNHSDKPNVEAQLVFDEKKYKIVYLAKKTIFPKEQLLVSYEDGEEGCYWDVLGIEPYPMTAKTFQLDEKLRLVEKPSKP